MLNMSLEKIAKKNNFINRLKYGSWIALNQFKYFKSQIKGFIGIGPAPEFLTRLMWEKFPHKTKERII